MARIPALYMTMIETAEIVADRYGITREVQDEYALRSQQRTAAAPLQPPDAEGLASAHDHDPSWCLKHQATMRWHDGNARGPGWFSHQLADGSYCKGHGSVIQVMPCSRIHDIVSRNLCGAQGGSRALWS